MINITHDTCKQQPGKLIARKKTSNSNCQKKRNIALYNDAYQPQLSNQSLNLFKYGGLTL